MSMLIQSRDPKVRRLLRIANAALVLGLLPWIFREYIAVNRNWLEAYCGFFLGLSVTINLLCLRAGRRCRAQAQQ